MNISDLRKYAAEFVGTFVLVLFGCGSAVAANALIAYQGLPMPLGFTTLAISFAFGLCIVAMAYSIGSVSGCHINPAVSIGAFVAGRMSVKDLAGYIVSQFLGGLAGAFILSMLLGSKENLGQNGYGSASALGTEAAMAVLIEIILTFVFVMVILCVTSKPEYSSVAGLVIGLTLTVIHIFGVPFTGTSVNPARSFGPAVLAGGDALKQLPVFIIAPIIGAVLASFFFTYVLEPGMTEAEELDEDDEEYDEVEEFEEIEKVEEDDKAEDTVTDAEEETADAVEQSADEADEENTDTEETDSGENGEGSEGGYNAAEEMMIDGAPESVAETEAAVIGEADSGAVV